MRLSSDTALSAMFGMFMERGPQIGPGRRTLYTYHRGAHRSKYAGMPFCGGTQERERLRARLVREAPSMPPMNAAQREWCLQQIELVEGYRRQDYVALDSRDLAKGVLDAWTENARDMGFPV